MSDPGSATNIDCEVQTPRTLKKAKACASCHARKIRCDLQLHEDTHATCSNCKNSGRFCQPHIRKRKHDQVRDAPTALHRADRHAGSRELGAHVPAREFPVHDTLTSSKQQPSYLGRSSYITGDFAVDEDDAHQYQSPSKTSTTLQTQIQRLASADETPQGPLRQSLLRNFMLYCRPWMPLIDETDLDKLDIGTRNSLLMTAMLVAGSIVSSTAQAAEAGQLCYQRAKILFYTGAEVHTLETIVATIFLQWLNPSGPEHVSIDSSSFWLRISVGLAHQLGLHREPDSKLPDAKLRRKIWWTLVARDNQIATSHGRPRAINLEDTSVRPLRDSDFDKQQDAALFKHFVRITSILGDMTEHYRRGTLSDRKKLNIEAELLRWLMEVPESLRLFDRDTRSLKEYSLKSRQLHIPYFTALIILFRDVTPTQTPSPLSSLAASFISGIFEEYLTHEDMSHLAAPAIFYLLVAALVQISYHRFPRWNAARTEEVQIINLSLNELKRRFPTALGAERVVNQAMKHAANLQTPYTPLRTCLKPEHQDFVSAFGPQLCRQWQVVFGSNEVDGPMGGRFNTRHAAGLIEPVSSSVRTESRFGTPDDLVNTLDHDPDWPGTVTMGPEDPAAIFLDQDGFDAVGRWWWQDWMPLTGS
ncbi:uncharacterized protein PV06_01796 [Exophiala oligosperma]|uniref:Zn(2)-C6 fungal-type domain-containing protein n=1 Tax=Exophiala oligosperma TaxID=215243 RepID=A0A0D2DUC1_9EURO|nr:uncharacterized protein PV06_01796 [Exophiala oligosperma]KIW46105.1 hypothetical protein PV06_01796 [Exophiala oligosperma]